MKKRRIPDPQARQHREARRAQRELQMHPNPDEGALLSVRRAARVMGLTSDVVYRRLERQDFPAHVLLRLGSRWFFRRRQLEAWLGMIPDHAEAETPVAAAGR